jgi:mono/diheme cytochrome c family protein
MRYFIAIFVFALVAVVSLAGFRGQKFTKPPLYIFPDMDWQPKYLPQGENTFFADHRDDRPAVAGTVQRGYAWAEAEVFSPDFKYAPSSNMPLYTGRSADGGWAKEFPVKVDAAFLQLGQAKFNINCAVCHGQVGDGNGITKAGYKMLTVRNLMEPYVSTQPYGQIFYTITYGKGKMGPYGDRLTPVERWAVIAYVKTLELAGNATMDDVPAAQRAKLAQ